MAQFARDGALVDLSQVLDMDAFGEQYAETWADLGSVDGTLSGIFIKASVKGLIWYNTNVWEEQGYEQPQTWDELMELSRQISASGSGARPWCVAVESGAASGWPGTDWIEDFVLRQAGADAYDAWYQGELAWTSPEIRQAWESWGEIVGDPRMVYGGAATMLTTNFGQGGNPLFTEPPGCYMFHQASFITDFFMESFPDLEPVEDFNFFPFPKMSEDAPESVEMAGDLFGMFNDTPQARALMRYLTTPEAQAIWVEAGGAISPNQQVPLDLYPDQLARQSAELLTGAEVVRFDASDLMPESMNNAFWQAVLEFIQNPDGLDRILTNLDRVQQDAYNQ